MSEAEDKIYMQRCLDLAKQAFGKTYPNPMVGSVIVHNGKIVGEGFHNKAGEAHAEVNAIKSVQDTSILEESTLYVNLEPCSHYGKTPPCTNAIIENKIPRVVIGCIDSYSEVSGRGIQKLKDSGIQVTLGVLEQQARELNVRFFTFHEKKRPYIILKWAQTLDGFIDIAPELKTESKGLWITDDVCKKLVHQWRTEEQAILIGTNTALVDNPQLTSRLVQGKNPLRIVIDLQNSLPQNLYVKDASTPTIIVSQELLPASHNMEYIRVKSKATMWDELFGELYTRNIQSIIIEGGTKILQDCIEKNLWDEMRVFTGPKKFTKGVAAPCFQMVPTIIKTVGNSRLEYYHNK